MVWGWSRREMIRWMASASPSGCHLVFVAAGEAEMGSTRALNMLDSRHHQRVTAGGMDSVQKMQMGREGQAGKLRPTSY